MKSFAFIPARHNSKRVPQKNSQLLGGKPLLVYTVEQALLSKQVDGVVVSTDIPSIRELLRPFEGEKRLRVCPRPETLAGDIISVEEVVLEILREPWAASVEYVVTLLPTSPFRTADTIDKCVRMFHEKKADSVLTIGRAKLKIGNHSAITGEFSLQRESPSARMSEWPLTAYDNPAVYVTRKSVLEEKKFVLGPKTFAVEIDKIEGHDINDPFDWAVGEMIIREGMAPAVCASAGVSVRHTGIVVEDMQKSRLFYEKLLGFEPVIELNEKGAYIDTFLGLRNVHVVTLKMRAPGGQMIELLHYQSHREPRQERPVNAVGISHLALTVNNLDELYGLLKGHGTRFVAPPAFSADKAVRVAFCQAPEGTYLELVEKVKR